MTETTTSSPSFVVCRPDGPRARRAVAARSAFAWRRMDTELAELVAEAPLEDARPVGVRGDERAMLLSFQAPGLAVEVEVLVVGGRRRLRAQLVPGLPGLVEVRTGPG